MGRRLTIASGVAAAVTALCCLTPVLPWVLGAIGLTGWIPMLYRDALLLPLLAGFLGLFALGIWRMRR